MAVGDVLELESGGWTVRADYDKLSELIEELKSAQQEWNSRELKAKVEALVAGTPITMAWAVAWVGSTMVGIGLNFPGYEAPMRCQNYLDKALDWVELIIEQERYKREGGECAHRWKSEWALESSCYVCGAKIPRNPR